MCVFLLKNMDKMIKNNRGSMQQSIEHNRTIILVEKARYFNFGSNYMEACIN